MLLTSLLPTRRSLSTRCVASETAARVVAGSIAKQLLTQRGITINAELTQIGKTTDPARFADEIQHAQADGDSIGGIISCRISGVEAGVGEPIFDKLQARLAYAMLSINACKGFEYGSGFAGVQALLDNPIDLKAANNGSLFKGDIAPKADNADMAVHLLKFRLTANGYVKAKLNVGKMKDYRIFIDGAKSDGNLTLLPATHEVVIKYMTQREDKSDSVDVNIECENEQLISIDTETKRSYTLADVLNGPHFRSTALLLVGAATLPELFDSILVQYRLCINYFHLEDCGKILVRGVKEKGDIKSTNALKEAFSLGASI